MEPDPWNQASRESFRTGNPKSKTAIDDATFLAAPLVVDDGTEGDKHWINGARQLVQGRILIILLQPPEHRTSRRCAVYSFMKGASTSTKSNKRAIVKCFS